MAVLRDMGTSEIKASIEAILFACAEPCEFSKIAQVLEADEDTIISFVKELQSEYEQAQRGILLVILDNAAQLCTNPKHASFVRSVLDIRRNTPLSQAALEVLSVVAYNQPVTKAFIEQIRGVDCSGVIGSLIIKNLIEEKGRLELPGRPLLYGTTPAFLRCMNISSLGQLPELPKKQEASEKEDEKA